MQHSHEESENKGDGVDVDRVLHACNTSVAFRVFLRVHRAKDAGQDDPQEEENKIPWPKVFPKPNWNEIGDVRDDGEDANDNGKHPSSISRNVLRSTTMHVGAIECRDSNTKDD